MDNDIKMIRENRQEDKEKIENFTRQRKDDAHDGKNGRKERDWKIKWRRNWKNL